MPSVYVVALGAVGGILLAVSLGLWYYAQKASSLQSQLSQAQSVNKARQVVNAELRERIIKMLKAQRAAQDKEAAADAARAKTVTDPGSAADLLNSVTKRVRGDG